jgi:hypothetical protein
VSQRFTESVRAAVVCPATGAAARPRLPSSAPRRSKALVCTCSGWQKARSLWHRHVGPLAGVPPKDTGYVPITVTTRPECPRSARATRARSPPRRCPYPTCGRARSAPSGSSLTPGRTTIAAEYLRERGADSAGGSSRRSPRSLSPRPGAGQPHRHRTAGLAGAGRRRPGGRRGHRRERLGCKRCRRRRVYGGRGYGR